MKTLNLNNLVVILSVLVISPLGLANLLNDPGFETNPLTTALNVLGNFTTYQGLWGPESASITGIDAGIIPPQGTKMLRVVNTGSYSQTFQITNVTALAALIDSGGATINLSALFNVNKSVPAALGGLSASFFSTATYGSIISPSPIASSTLDNAPNTWQAIAVSGAVPVGTRWILSQVFFMDSSLLGIDGNFYPGYVDAADMTIIPEPATLVLLTIGALVLRKTKESSR